MNPRFALAGLCGLLFGGLLSIASPGQFAMAMATAFVLPVILRQPYLGLALFAFTATFMPYSTVELGVRITLSEALLAMACLGTLWQLCMHRLHWSWGPTEKAVLLLMVFSALPFAVGQLTIHTDDNGLVNWARWLLNLSTIFLVPLLLADAERRERLIVVLLAGSLALLLLSLTEFLRHQSTQDMISLLTRMHYAHTDAVRSIFTVEHARLATPWVHPNLTGGALVLFVPLGLSFALVREGWKRWLGSAVALLGGVALLLSSSRGAMLSLAAVLIWMACLRVPATRQILLAAAVIGVVLVLFYPPLHARIATMFSAGNASTQVRMDEYRRFPEAVARYPLGIGFKADPPVPGSGLLGISNLWLNYVYKLGLLGMLMYCAVIWRWWRECRPRGAIDKLGPANGIWLGSLAGIVAALLTGLFDHYYSFTVVLVALFWLMLGINLQAARELYGVRRAQRNPSLLPFTARLPANETSHLPLH
ncbi:O-antigen ligase family protein [Dyella flagellata]|uniref:Biofilm formation protein PslJ n=1 Tax=Dyella flagellata TaxID=1867833 RepID=A0ABQ5XCQ5_9GAMM|nr:O-antigen ligase family protein [Dyella flagellata]GLQ89444.1 biofilm formation protein PslJ [Dyella flagellata]